MSRDGERLIELVNDLGTRISHAFSDMVPPSAQVHLLNAQRELITALMLIYEHRVTAGPTVQTRRRAATPRRTTTAARSAARRSRKIPIE